MDVVRRRRRLLGWLLALTVLGALVALALGSRHAPTWSATAQVFVAVDPTDTPATHDADDAAVVQERADAYAGAATSPEVLRAVVTRLNLPESWTALSGQVDAEHADGTLTVDVTATTPTAVQARTVADAVADQLVLEARRLEPTTANGGALVKLTVTEPATTPTAPDGLGPVTTGLLGGALGLGAGLVVVLVRRRRDPTVHGPRDAASVTTAPVLGAVPLVRAVGRPRDVGTAVGRDADPVARAVHDLAAGVRGLPVAVAVRSLVVTSADEGEGKSSVAAHLAHQLALAGERVVLVDADLRRPRQHQVWGTSIGPGLVDVLAGAVDVGPCLVPVATDPSDTTVTASAGSLALLPAGGSSARSTDLVGTHRMNELLRALEAQGYLVVVDAPPLLPVVDGAVLARMAEGALLVARAHRTRRDHLAGATELLRTSGAGLLGVVVNGADDAGHTRASAHRGRDGRDRLTAAATRRAGTTPARLRPSVTRLHREKEPAGS